MSTKITELRKAGKLQEAYELSLQEYDKDKNNNYIKNSYGWVLYELIKEKLGNNNIKGLDKYIDVLKELNLDKGGDFDINEILAGQFYKKLKTINDINQYKLLLFYYSKLDNSKPSSIHSYILFDVINRYKKNDNYFDFKFDFYGFIKLWGINNFQHEDYQEGEYNGKTTQSTFEKVVSILGNEIKNTKDINVLGNIDDLEKLLEIGINKELKWAGLYLGKLKILSGDYLNAEKLIFKIVKNEKTQFWSWHLLGEVLLKQGKKELYFSALSKALNFGNDDNFLNNLREEYIYELVKKDLFNEANIELNLIIKNKLDNENKISDSLNNLMKNDWYIKNTKGNNKSFYNKNVGLIEEYLYSDIDDKIIYIDYINENKYILNFTDKNKKRGFFNFKNIKNKNFKKGDVIKVKIEKIEDEYYNVYKIYNEKYEVSELFSYKNVLIEYINKDKKIINFVGEYDHGFFKYTGFEDVIKILKGGDFLEVIFGKSDGEYYNILDCKKSSLEEDLNLKKKFKGIINIKDGNSFGFVDNMFVGKDFLKGINDGDNITGTVIKSYNKKKFEMNWKVINIKS